MYEIVGQPPSSSARPTADLFSDYPHSSQGPPPSDSIFDDADSEVHAAQSTVCSKLTSSSNGGHQSCEPLSHLVVMVINLSLLSSLAQE